MMSSNFLKKFNVVALSTALISGAAISQSADANPLVWLSVGQAAKQSAPSQKPSLNEALTDTRVAPERIKNEFGIPSQFIETCRHNSNIPDDIDFSQRPQIANDIRICMNNHMTMEMFGKSDIASVAKHNTFISFQGATNLWTSAHAKDLFSCRESLGYPGKGQEVTLDLQSTTQIYNCIAKKDHIRHAG